MPQAEKCARRLGNHHAIDAQLLGKCRRVHRPAATEGDHGKVAGVVTATHGDELQGIDHVGVGDPDHAKRRLVDGDTKAFRHRLHRLPRQVETDADLTAEKIVGIDAAGDQVGVGDRRLSAPLTVACRARDSARRPWPNLKRPASVDPGDAAAAGADLDDIDDWYANRIAGVIASRSIR